MPHVAHVGFSAVFRGYASGLTSECAIYEDICTAPDGHSFKAARATEKSSLSLVAFSAQFQSN